MEVMKRVLEFPISSRLTIIYKKSLMDGKLLFMLLPNEHVHCPGTSRQSVRK
jgi:hypothetical protein